MFNNTLIIAPHADDEVLGCGGFIWKQSENNKRIDVIVISMGGVHHPHLPQPATYHDRYRELEKSCAILGCRIAGVLYPNMDMRMDSVPMVDIVSKIDEIIIQNNYDSALIPYPSFNHDHKIAFDAAWSALRPRQNTKVRTIACYEYGYVQHQPAHSLSPAGGKIYIPLNKEAFSAKLAAIRCYPSQLRPSPAPTDENTIEALARLRGIECHQSGVSYAELFYLQKMVV